MSSLMKIDIQQMRSELNVLEHAIEVFENFVRKGFRNEIGMVSAMRSDFTSSLENILKNMEDENAVNVLEKLKQYHKTALTIVDTLEEDTDKVMAGEIGGKIHG